MAIHKAHQRTTTLLPWPETPLPEPKVMPGGQSLALVRVHGRAFVFMNILYFGVILLAAGYAMFDPTVQASLTTMVSSAFSPSGALGPLIQAYEEDSL